jgi:hypothetical protein
MTLGSSKSLSRVRYICDSYRQVLLSCRPISCVFLSFTGLVLLYANFLFTLLASLIPWELSFPCLQPIRELATTIAAPNWDGRRLTDIPRTFSWISGKTLISESNASLDEVSSVFCIVTLETGGWTTSLGLARVSSSSSLQWRIWVSCRNSDLS